MTKTLLSLGHGFSARELGRQLVPLGWRVIGTTRKPEKCAAFEAEGIEPLLWPCDMEQALRGVTHLLTSISPDDQGDPVLRDHRAAILDAMPNLKWVGYLSTTGVYGDHDGGWVDEDSPTDPATLRGQRRVLAEREWRDIPGLPIHIFRLAGIYGPGRGPFAKLRKGTAQRIIKKNQVFSRTHIEDIAQVLMASMANPNPGRIYNVCDDDPAPPQDVIEYAAELLNMEPPPEVPFEEAQMSPMARSFYSDSKCVHNTRIKQELGVTLKHPTYKAALRAMLDAEKNA
ncbi:SDR family oxidoreductase [Shimia sediminis]|uniref:SDR family oxidoreductase n=1 Tax=Shimia sediminis TaxID=2497945 RepID=UPI000F8E0626|nr:SDR family oxidoreductase [Shimia sediminis]